MLPVIHPQRRRLRRGLFVTGIYEDTIAIVRLRDWDGLTAAAYAPDGWRALSQAPHRGPSLIAPLASIRELEVTPRRRRSRVRRIRVTVDTDQGQTSVNTWWPAYDPLYAVLEGVLGDRLVIHKAKLDWKFVLLLAVTVWPPVLIEMLAALSNPELLAGIAAGFFVAAFWYTTLRLTGDRHVGSEAPRRPRKQRRREPLRSQWAWPLRLFGLLVMVAVFILNTKALQQVQSDRETMFAFPIVAALAYVFTLLAMWIIQVGYQLGLKGLSKSRRPGETEPIVYLRAFDDDAKHTLNRQGFTSMVMGVEPPPMFADMRPPWRYFGNGHPLRIARLVAARGGDTSEEQLARFMRRWGPFVAIGRPGELVATPGADRFYVSDETWQKEVRGLLAQARGVVLQPGASAGIWWEIAEVFRTVPPERVLLVLSALGGPAGYRAFRVRFGAETGLLLPEHAGDAPFIRFDADGTAHLVPAVHRTPFVWCFRSTTINLRQTLASFSGNLNREPSSRDTTRAWTPHRPDSPLPPPRVRRTPFSCAMAALIWYIVLVGGYTLAGAVVRDPQNSFANVQDIWRESSGKIAGWFIAENDEPSTNDNAHAGVSPSDVNDNTITGVSPSDIDSATPPSSKPKNPPWIAVTYHSPELECAMDLGSGWRAIPAIKGWDRTYTGPYGVTLCLQAVLVGESTVSVADVEAWLGDRVTSSGFTNARLASSGVNSSEAGDFAWAILYGDKPAGTYPFQGGVLPLEKGQLQFVFTNDSPGWDDDHADVVACALKGLRPDTALASMTAPVPDPREPTLATETIEPTSELAYDFPSLGCSLVLGSEWRRADDAQGWDQLFVGPSGLRLLIAADVAREPSPPDVLAADVEAAASSLLINAGFAKTTVVKSGISKIPKNPGIQFIWARVDGETPGAPRQPCYYCVVPLTTGDFKLLFWGSDPDWQGDEVMASIGALNGFRLTESDAAVEFK